MSELETVRFLREHGLTALTDRYKITVKRHQSCESLVFLKYGRIDSPMGEPIVQECRGLILDEADGWRVVSYPFLKFFNSHEGYAAPIDWNTARVCEKLDGSLITIYWYRGCWMVATNGTPDGSGPAPGSGGNFRQLFWHTWNCDRLPDDTDCCYMFELMTPWNRVIVPHGEARVALIGVRNRVTLQELEPEPIAERYGWQCAKSFPLRTIDECLAAAQALDPMECEGYVVRDAAFNRIKVKCPQYVALAHMKDGLSERRMLELIRVNESDEFLSYFPEYRELHDRIRVRFNDLADGLEADYARLRHIVDQKAFALEAVKTRCSSALFAVRKGSATDVRDFLRSCTRQALERAIGPLRDEVLEVTP